MLNLGVNIDHIATVRQARMISSPSPLEGALLALEGGAWGITAHLREDRRHIQDSDIEILAREVPFLNMEMAVTDEMLAIAARVRPHSSCLVPEKRQELTTEGGLDVAGRFDRISGAVKQLHADGIIVSLFIDPDFKQIEAAAKAETDYIELHTGAYANATGEARQTELDRLVAAAKLANSLGIKVNAGHGIDCRNIKGILEIPGLHELNIGHSIVGRAIMVGMKQATAEMVECMKGYRGGRQ